MTVTRPEIVWDYSYKISYLSPLNIPVQDYENTLCFPNPTDSKVKFSGMAPNSTCEVLSLDGRILIKGMLYDGQLDLSGLRQGIYIVTFTNGEKVTKFKVIKL
jgi:hypothetical protein